MRKLGQAKKTLETSAANKNEKALERPAEVGETRSPLENALALHMRKYYPQHAPDFCAESQYEHSYEVSEASH